MKINFSAGVCSLWGVDFYPGPKRQFSIGLVLFESLEDARMVVNSNLIETYLGIGPFTPFRLELGWTRRDFRFSLSILHCTVNIMNEY